MTQYQGRTGVIGGAGSGFGLEAVRTEMREQCACFHRHPQALRAAD